MQMKVSVAKSNEGHKIGVDVAKMIREDEAHKSVIDRDNIGGQLASLGSTSYKRSSSQYGGDRHSSGSVTISSTSVSVHADVERHRREAHEMKELNAEKSIIIAKLKRELEHKDETIESLKKELFHSKKDDRLDDYRID
jgi:hypothetical protein